MTNRLVMTVLVSVLAMPVTTVANPIPYESCFELGSRRHGIKLDLLMAVAYQESSWDAAAQSEANAHGLMQIRWPVTARHLGSTRVAELYNPCLNIDLGASYLKELAGKYDGDIDLMLAAYNYGPTRIQSSQDIPAGVWRYIKGVKQHQARIRHQLNQQPIPYSSESSESSNFIELIRFSRHERAVSYLDSLKVKVPGAALSISETNDHSIILLSQELTTQDARYRLARLLPDLF